MFCPLTEDHTEIQLAQKPNFEFLDAFSSLEPTPGEYNCHDPQYNRHDPYLILVIF